MSLMQYQQRPITILTLSTFKEKSKFFWNLKEIYNEDETYDFFHVKFKILQQYNPACIN